jgi:hypothetical protein
MNSFQVLLSSVAVNLNLRRFIKATDDAFMLRKLPATPNHGNWTKSAGTNKVGW